MTTKIFAKRDIAIFCVFVLTLLCLLFSCYDSAPSNSGNITFGVIESINETDAQALADSIVSENMFQVFINTNMTIGADNMADILVQNTANNHYPCQIEIFDENGKLIYKSGIIDPGYKLERDEIAGLDIGSHACIAYFHILNNNDNNGQEINQIGVNVMITRVPK